MMEICQLCGKRDKLCNSHILPKSFTRRMRAGAPQVKWVVVKDKPRALTSNGEYTDHLLCKSCESMLSKNYEDYGTQLFVNKRNIDENNRHIFFTNFEYQKYYLFIVSILWRASVSSLETYRHIQWFSELSNIFKSCILQNTLQIHPPHPIRLDDFVKISILKIIDHAEVIPQETLNSLILGLNFESGDHEDSGTHYYFMVDGFLVVIHLFPLNSSLLKQWRPSGVLRNRIFQKIPKVSFCSISQLRDCIAAIASTQKA